MKQYLKSYRIVMHTIGPVFIGNGKEIGKKEYVFLNNKQVGIPDMQGLYQELSRRRKEMYFEDYLLGNNKMGLTEWLKKQNIKMNDIKPFIRYTLDCGDAIIEKGGNKLQVMECVKDAYEMPYIPGSSLKGMFRTILLGADVFKSFEKYKREKRDMWQKLTVNAGRMYYLKSNVDSIEKVAFRQLNRPETKPGDAVNDILQGLKISDSAPISTDNLVLCQKIDRHPNGVERELPLLRECIKPDTEICFTMTIDTSICRLDEKQLMEAVKLFINRYCEEFASAFVGINMLKSDYVLCGGGCGFVSKTVVYPMYGKTEGIEFTQHVFDMLKVPQKHKHNKDKMYGASPHIIKCTRYQGRTLQMGICKIDKIESI